MTRQGSGRTTRASTALWKPNRQGKHVASNHIGSVTHAYSTLGRSSTMTIKVNLQQGSNAVIRACQYCCQPTPRASSSSTMGPCSCLSLWGSGQPQAPPCGSSHTYIQSTAPADTWRASGGWQRVCQYSLCPWCRRVAVQAGVAAAAAAAAAAAVAAAAAAAA